MLLQLYFLASASSDKLHAVNNFLDTEMREYSEWGTEVGLGMFAACMFASLIGIIIKSL